jgi:uncharacterized protein YjbJ (UPF0337 family)
MPFPKLRMFLLGAAAGASTALLLDPRLGARRRALVRDKSRRYGRDLAGSLMGSARSVRGPVRGAAHALARRTPWRETEAPPDQSEYVKHRVETALGRERDLPLHAINIDAADAIVHVRGAVPDAATADRIVRAAAAVEGVRAVMSHLRTPDGTPVGGEAGDTGMLHGRPRAAILGEAVRGRLLERWPGLTDSDILASEGHVDRLVATICTRTGEPESAVRTAVDEILLTAV